MRMPRHTYERVAKMAKARGESVQETIIAIVTQETLHIELTEQDYEKIIKEIKLAKARIDRC